MLCWADFTIATRGYSFRKGQVKNRNSHRDKGISECAHACVEKIRCIVSGEKDGSVLRQIANQEPSPNAFGAPFIAWDPYEARIVPMGPILLESGGRLALHNPTHLSHLGSTGSFLHVRFRRLSRCRMGSPKDSAMNHSGFGTRCL
jgi:hypothetical protein